MSSCILLLAGLLTSANAAQPAESAPGDKPHKEFVIEVTWEKVLRGKAPRHEFFFEWKLVPQWRVEIRGYQFHRGTLPKLPVAPLESWKIELRGYQEFRGVPKTIDEITIDKVITSPLKPPAKPRNVLTIHETQVEAVEDLPAEPSAAADGRRLIGFWELIVHRGGGRC